jgi:putative nucleotidyltransferase with HDIG domain
MAQDDRTSSMDLASVISADQALTAKILRLANSPYYGYARRIGNVREAVVLLGMRTVRSVAISSAIIDAFRLPEYVGEFSTDLFWAHSVTVGLVAELIAKESKACRPEDAFTAGVLHDVGKLATILSDPAGFSKVAAMAGRRQTTFCRAELEVFGVDHARVGAELVTNWKFPENLVGAIRDHHPAHPVMRIAGLADVVAVANLASNRSGMACGFDFTSTVAHEPTVFLPVEAERALARVPGGMLGISEKARAFLVNVTVRPPRWFDLDQQVSVTDRAVA